MLRSRLIITEKENVSSLDFNIDMLITILSLYLLYLPQEEKQEQTLPSRAIF